MKILLNFISLILLYWNLHENHGMRFFDSLLWAKFHLSQISSNGFKVQILEVEY
jgi:hypothetical protein